MINFNVEGLFYIGPHIARTMIAGCVTECGRKLQLGEPWSRTQPEVLCRVCTQKVQELVFMRGMRG